MSSSREVAVDIAKALKGVFKISSRRARKNAWRALSTGKGKAEIDKLVDNPDRSVNTISRLSFREWLDIHNQTPF